MPFVQTDLYMDHADMDCGPRTIMYYNLSVAFSFVEGDKGMPPIELENI